MEIMCVRKSTAGSNPALSARSNREQTASSHQPARRSRRDSNRVSKYQVHSPRGWATGDRGFEPKWTPPHPQSHRMRRLAQVIARRRSFALRAGRDGASARLRNWGICERQGLGSGVDSLGEGSGERFGCDGPGPKKNGGSPGLSHRSTGNGCAREAMASAAERAGEGAIASARRLSSTELSSQARIGSVTFLRCASSLGL